jgi:hypothetical protein
LVALLACLVGTVFISLLVSVIDANTKLEEPENNVLAVIQKDDSENLRRTLAAQRLQLAWVTRKIHGTKPHSLNVCANYNAAHMYAKLAKSIVVWRMFLRRYKYLQHDSFKERHVASQLHIYRVAKVTAAHIRAAERWKCGVCLQLANGNDRKPTPTFVTPKQAKRRTSCVLAKEAGDAFVLGPNTAAARKSSKGSSSSSSSSRRSSSSSSIAHANTTVQAFVAPPGPGPAVPKSSSQCGEFEFATQDQLASAHADMRQRQDRLEKTVQENFAQIGAALKQIKSQLSCLGSSGAKNS